MILVRLFLLVSLLTVPFTGLGGAFFGIKGAILGTVIVWLGLFFAALWAEKGIARAHGATSQVPKGLARSLDRVLMEEKSSLRPRVMVYSDASPNALAIASLGGPGTILLSQGLIALLNEEELRVVLLLCLSRLKESGIRFQSFCSILAVWALGFAPPAWVGLVFSGKVLSKSDEGLLHPPAVVGFLVVFPLARLFLRLGKPVRKYENPGKSNEFYAAALQKIVHAIQIWGPGKNQGAFSLYFVNPGSGQVLFPFD